MHPDITNYTARDDFTLMGAIAAGKQAALAALFDRYAPIVLAMCRHILKNQSLAEEVLNDVFWEVWDRSERYGAQRSSPRTYLLMLTRSRAIDRLRTEHPHREVTVLNSQEDEANQTPDPRSSGKKTQLDSAVSGELRHHVAIAMQTLDPQRRQAVELSFFDGLSHSQIAQQLNQPLGTIKTRIRQGLVHLRDALSAYHKAEE